MKPNARWTDDCSGKKDYDGDVLSISTRYWPAGGGFYVLDSNGFRENKDGSKPRANASLLFWHAGIEEYETIVESGLIEGESFEEVKEKVESWVQAQYDKAHAALRAAFNGSGEL